MEILGEVEKNLWELQRSTSRPPWKVRALEQFYIAKILNIKITKSLKVLGRAVNLWLFYNKIQKYINAEIQILSGGDDEDKKKIVFYMALYELR